MTTSLCPEIAGDDRPKSRSFFVESFDFYARYHTVLPAGYGLVAHTQAQTETRQITDMLVFDARQIDYDNTVPQKPYRKLLWQHTRTETNLPSLSPEQRRVEIMRPIVTPRRVYQLEVTNLGGLYGRRADFNSAGQLAILSTLNRDESRAEWSEIQRINSLKQVQEDQQNTLMKKQLLQQDERAFYDNPMVEYDVLEKWSTKPEEAVDRRVDKQGQAWLKFRKEPVGHVYEDALFRRISLARDFGFTAIAPMVFADPTD